MLLRFGDYAHLCEERKADLDLLERHCSSSRFDELLQGAPLTGVERRLLNAAIAEERLEAAEGESWEITKVQSTSGAHAYIACVLKGSSMEGVAPDLIGVNSDLPSARQSVEALGYISVEDFQHATGSAELHIHIGGAGLSRCPTATIAKASALPLPTAEHLSNVIQKIIQPPTRRDSRRASASAC